MILYFLQNLIEESALFNVLRYITFRTGAALMTALILSFLAGPFFIRWLKARQLAGQPIRDDGPPRHIEEKAGTPTMGGILILTALFFSALLWADLSNGYVWAALFAIAGFGAIGLADDILKIKKHSARGISAYGKMALQTLVALITIYAILSIAGEGATDLALPFFKNLTRAAGHLLSHLRALCHCGCFQRRQSHRRAGRTGYRSRHDCRFFLGAYHLSCREQRLC